MEVLEAVADVAFVVVLSASAVMLALIVIAACSWLIGVDAEAQAE